jgi:hypothetical protein
MKKMTIAAMASAISLAFSATAMANAMPKTEYKIAKKNITTEYKVAKAGCGTLLANAKDICMAEAKGKESVALAELAARNHPGRNARNDVRIAKAQAAYAVAREKCDDLAGNANDVCVKEAESARNAARTDSMPKIKTARARKTFREKSAQVRAEARTEILGAR